jgi:hypothetical protein
MQIHSSPTLAVYCLVTGVASAAAILWLLWLGLERAGLERPSRIRTWGVTAVIVAAWFLGFSWLGARGFFAASTKPAIPALPLAVFVSIPIGVWFALGNSAVRKAVAALPLAALIGVQFYRVNGLIFVLYTLRGELPGAFGFPAGLGDIAVGLLAIVSAWMLTKGAAYARTAAYLWNALGILDLVVALTMGFLSSPSPLQRVAFDHPNTLISAYPLVMIPVFLVPLSLILHILSLWRLGRQRASAKQPLGLSSEPVPHFR